jgi:hypothetical protein
MNSQTLAKTFFETRFASSSISSHLLTVFRFGHVVSLEIAPNYPQKDFSKLNVNESLPPRTGLLSLANLQPSLLSDELSFSDVFG